MTVKNHWLVLTTMALAAIFSLMPGHAADRDRAIKALMRRKLVNAEKVLEGLAVNNFDMVANNGDELIQVGKESEWAVLKTPEYKLYSNDFRRIAERLVQQAKAKNTDGIALAYVDLTLTCVKCHQHVREIRMARLD